MKMGINANENWALAFCLVFPRPPSVYPSPQSTFLTHVSHLSGQTNSCGSTSLFHRTLSRHWRCTLCVRTFKHNVLHFPFVLAPSFFIFFPSHVYALRVCMFWRMYLQFVCGQGLGSFHDDLLNPFDGQVTSCLLQTVAEEADHL